MTLQELMNKIRLPEEAQKAVLEYQLNEDVYVQKRDLLYKDIRTFFEELKEREDHLQWFLSFALKLAVEVYDTYQERKISDQIYVDTFYDITIWCEECYRRYGVYGLKEAGWIAYSLLMKLFRLGRLQFEPMTLSEELKGSKGSLPIGTPMLNVHIPAGEKLNYEECKKSFAMAEEFFGDTYEGYMCDSWLLSPALKEFLPENSNIIKFQNLFEVVKVHYLFPQAEQRIFSDIREDKENYPENTLLQKRAKAYILQGNDPGIGIGIIYK